MKRIEIIAAMAKGRVIGRKGAMPWAIPSELKHFKRATIGKPVIMGRRTWATLPVKPLPGRLNIVLTRQAHFAATGASVVSDKAQALRAAGEAQELAIIGGAEIYKLFLDSATHMRLTEIDLQVDGDAWFPAFDRAQWEELSVEDVQADEAAKLPAYHIRLLKRVTP